MVCLDLETCEAFAQGGLTESVRLRADSHARGCADCRRLLEDVTANLAAIERLRRSSPASTESPERLTPSDGRGPMNVVGRYRLVREIGRGGMGVVYEAEQIDPPRKVAMKILNGVRAGDPCAAALFRAEALAFSRLNHPGIATVFDAGYAQDGRGYFAMELVRGEPISRYVARRNLGVTERVQLMRAVCDAVHHAHQRGVLHRDLKPENVLVTEGDGLSRMRADWAGNGAAHSPQKADSRNPMPKVVDFGLARLSDREDPAGNGEDHFIGSISAMSPEQARGEVAAIDVRSDVYSLGALLYETLTARIPYDVDPTDAAGIIDAVRAGQISLGGLRGLRGAGDLDAIIRKALAHHPQGRYESAAALGDDLDRLLRLEPVRARAGGRMYAARRFVRRHRTLTVATATVAVSLGAGLAVSLWQGAEARRASEVAEDRLAETLAHADYLLNAVVPALWRHAGTDEARHEIVARIVEFFEHVGPAMPEHEAVQQGWWESLRAMSGLHSARGEPELALGAIERSHALIVKAMERSPTGDLSFPYAYSLQYLTAALDAAGRREESLARARETVAAFDRAVSRNPDNAEYLALAAWNMERLALKMAESSESGDAVSLMARATDAYHRAVAMQPESIDLSLRVAAHAVGRASLLDQLGLPDEATNVLRESISLCVDLATRAPEDSRVIEREALLQLALARRMARTGDAAEAIPALDRAIAIFDRLRRLDPLMPRHNTRFEEATALRESLAGR